MQSEKMSHTQPALHSRRAQQFAEAGLKIATDTAGMLGRSHSHWRKGGLTTVSMRAPGSQWRKCLTVVVLRSASLRSAGLESTLSGICGTISTFHTCHSGPVELQWSRERLLRRTQRQKDVISTSHLPGLGLEPIHLLLSWRARGLHSECLRRPVTIRSVHHFQAQ